MKLAIPILLLTLFVGAETALPTKDFSHLATISPDEGTVIKLDPPKWVGEKDLFMNCFICGKHVAADEDGYFKTDYWGRVVLVHPACIKTHEENAK